MKNHWIMTVFCILLLWSYPSFSGEEVLCDQIFQRISEMEVNVLAPAELKKEKVPVLARVLQGYMMASFEHEGTRWMLILSDQSLILSPALDLQKQIAMIHPWKDLQINPMETDSWIEAQIQDKMLLVSIQQIHLSKSEQRKTRIQYSLEKLLQGKSDQARISMTEEDIPLSFKDRNSLKNHPEKSIFTYKMRETNIEWMEVHRNDQSIEYRLSFVREGRSEKIESSSFFLPASWSILQFHARSEYSRPEKFLFYLLAKTPQGLKNFVVFTNSDLR